MRLGWGWLGVLLRTDHVQGLRSKGTEIREKGRHWVQSSSPKLLSEPYYSTLMLKPTIRLLEHTLSKRANPRGGEDSSWNLGG